MRLLRAAAVIATGALACNIFVATAARADNRHRLTGVVTASRTSSLNPHPTDAFCIENDPFFGPVPGVEQHWKLWIGGREVVKLLVCYEFTGGALGGNDLRGVWTISTAEGKLTGTLTGTAGHAGVDLINITLTPVSGTRGLHNVHEPLAFVGCDTFTRPNPIRGIVTTPGSGVEARSFCPSQ